MSSAKHEKSFVDFEKGYEQNVVGLKGIIYFGVGLLLLIVITFGLMWALRGVLEDQAKSDPAKTFRNPMREQMKDKDKLPPEPRLQVAPGFQVEGQNGVINLELKAPQAEYWELRKQWEKAWEEGVKDPKTGTVVALPMDRAKELLVEKNVKARSGPDADKAFQQSRLYVNDSSSGRVADIRRR